MKKCMISILANIQQGFKICLSCDLRSPFEELRYAIKKNELNK